MKIILWVLFFPIMLPLQIYHNLAIWIEGKKEHKQLLVENNQLKELSLDNDYDIEILKRHF